MGLSVKPLILFAQKRPTTLDTPASIIPTPQADRVYDDVTGSRHLLSRIWAAFKTSALWLQAGASELICSICRPVGNTGSMSTRLLLVTKYGLRLHVSHDATIQISYSPDPQLRKKGVRDDLDGCDSNLPTLNAVTPLRDPIPSPPFSYTFLADWCTSFLWYKDYFDGPHVDGDVIEDRYPRLAEVYFEWVEIHENAFVLQELHLGREAELFPEKDDYLAWYTEGFLLACWLALQDDVQEVDYNGYHLRKGRLEEELVQFLVNMD
jgi:hypothetical protein